MNTTAKPAANPEAPTGKRLSVIYHDEVGVGGVAIHIRFKEGQVDGAQALEEVIAAIYSQASQVIEAVAPGAEVSLRITDVMGLQGVLFRGIEKRIRSQCLISDRAAGHPQSLPQSLAAADMSG